MKTIVGALSLLLLLVVSAASAEELPPACQGPPAEKGVYLLTMQPGGAIFNAFGHNGLMVKKQSSEKVYNYGVYDSSHPNLVTGFVTSTLPYQLGVRSYQSMIDLYTAEDRTVILTRLDVPYSSTLELGNLLEENAKPENRFYAYHWFRDSCSTRVRDLVDLITEGALARQTSGPSGLTKRMELQRHTGNQVGLWFLFNYVLSPEAEDAMSRWEAMYSPARLRQELNLLSVKWPDGEVKPLVAWECTVREGSNPPALASPPDWDAWLWMIGLGLAVVLALLGWKLQHRVCRFIWVGLVASFGLLGAALGTASVAVWLMDGLGIFSLTWNLPFANPASLLWVAVAILVLVAKPRRVLVAQIIAMSLTTVAFVGAIIALMQQLSHDNFGVIGLFFPPMCVIAFTSPLKLLASVHPQAKPDSDPSAE